MEYKFDVLNTSTTNPWVNAAINQIQAKFNKNSTINQNFDFSEGLQNTIQYLKQFFMSSSYEHYSQNDRLKTLEYCITQYSGKNNFIFTSEEDLELSYKFNSKDEILRSFLINLIIYIAERSDKLALQVVMDIEILLKQKNEKYGDAALNPIRIFSPSNAQEQILVRIDDKLNRIKQKSIIEDEDVMVDLLGYMILLNITNNFLNVE